MNVYEATGYIVSQLTHEKNITFNFSQKTKIGTDFVTEDEKETIYMYMTDYGIQFCINNKGVDLKILRTSPLANYFQSDYAKDYAIKKFVYSKMSSDTKKLDEVITFILEITK